MKKRLFWLISVVLATAVLFSGCASVLIREQLESVREQLEELQTQTEPPAEPQEGELLFSQMVYTRPDMEQLYRVLEASCAAAAGSDLDAVMDGVWAFYDEFDWFYTNYSLADIRYSMDLTDGYWEEEYYFCTENSARVDAALEDLYYALAASPCREELEGEDYFGQGYFDSYDGDNNWDEAFTALLEREAELQNSFYSLSGEALELTPGSSRYYSHYGDDLAQVLVELIGVRQEMAAHWGYASYPEFAWDFYYYRDYTPAEMESYMEAVCRELVPLYERMALTDVWDYSYGRSTEGQIYACVRTAAENMGGKVWDAFEVMEERQLYDISYSENKYSTSFEMYLTCYEVPFVFLCPSLENYDKLTFAHEFGHFCNDYHSYGSAAGVDVLEVFSQAMEYLLLCYGEDTRALARVKLADSLSTYVEQSAFATFEHRMYSLEEPTVEDLYRLYDEVARDFGFESVGYDPREFVTISHFYTNPMYIDSYVVSNDAAMQLYQLELEEAGAGLKRYETHLDTWQTWFLAFLDEAQLESPFAPGRLEGIRDLFEQQLLG